MFDLHVAVILDHLTISHQLDLSKYWSLYIGHSMSMIKRKVPGSSMHIVDFTVGFRIIHLYTSSTLGSAGSTDGWRQIAWPSHVLLAASQQAQHLHPHGHWASSVHRIATLALGWLSGQSQEMGTSRSSEQRLGSIRAVPLRDEGLMFTAFCCSSSARSRMMADVTFM